MDFSEKIVVISGGSSGIGLETAKLFARHGSQVWLLARSPDKLQTARRIVAEDFKGPNQHCEVIAVDVQDSAAVNGAIQRVLEKDRKIDILINSAGAAYPGYVEDLSLDVFHWMMDANYFGTVNLCKSVLPSMIDKKAGTIVNISSIAGFMGVFGYTAYGASKYAVRGFSDVLRAEVKRFGIQVHIVFPPDTDTPQLAYENQFKPAETKILAGSSGIIKPEEVARDILKGIDRGRYVIIPGSEGKLLYWLSGVLGTWLYPLMDHMVASAQKKISQGMNHSG